MKFKFEKGDIFGGITAGVVALPLALAFGVQAGLGPASGLYGAIILGFLASIFGGTDAQISGPTGPMTVVSFAAITTFVAAAGSVQEAMGAIVACFVLAGIFQILMGVLRIGTLIRFIPYPVISGFMSGIGVIIILLQIFPAAGLPSPSSPLKVITSLGTLVQDVNWWALFYTGMSFVIIYLFPKITKAVPSTLVALIAITILSVIIDADVPILGNIPTGLPKFLGLEILNVSPALFDEIFTTALALAALGSIDSLLTSVIADNITKTRHKSNRELFGQGIGNTVSGLFAGLPGAGATMRTLVNIRSGGKTKVSGVLHSITLAAILLGAGRYASLIPNSVLAGILITVGIGILDYKGLKHIAKVPRSDAAIMILVLLATVFLDLLIAVGIGMVLASLLFMKKMSDLVEEHSNVSELSSFTNEISWIDEVATKNLKDKVFVKNIKGPLFFGFAKGFQHMTEQLHNIRYVILRMEQVPFIDQTGLYALEETILALEQKDIDVLITGLQTQPELMLRRLKIVPSLIDEENLFSDFESSIAWLKSKLNDNE